MNKIIEKYLNVMGLLFCFCFIVLSITSRAQALTFDFNDGTRQGWIVEFNNDPGFNPAVWYDGANYSGNPAIGRAPIYGPLDDFDGSIGAIYGGIFTSDESISTFTFPIFVPRPMDNISARFIIGGPEHGIAPSLQVHGQAGYKRAGSDNYLFGPYTPLDQVIHSGGEYAYPLWTRASLSVGDGHMVTRLIVKVRVEGTSWGFT